MKSLFCLFIILTFPHYTFSMNASHSLPDPFVVPAPTQAAIYTFLEKNKTSTSYADIVCDIVEVDYCLNERHNEQIKKFLLQEMLFFLRRAQFSKKIEKKLRKYIETKELLCILRREIELRQSFPSSLEMYKDNKEGYSISI